MAYLASLRESYKNISTDPHYEGVNSVQRLADAVLDAMDVELYRVESRSQQPIKGFDRAWAAISERFHPHDGKSLPG